MCSFDDFCRGQKLDSELIWKPWPLAPSLLDKWSSTLRTLRSLGVGTRWSNLIFWGSKFTTGYEPCWFPRSCGDVSDESNIYRSFPVRIVYVTLCNYIWFYSMSIQDRRECSCPPLLFKVYSFSMGFTCCICCIHQQVGISSKDALNSMRSELLDLPDWERRTRHGHGKKWLVLSCFTPLFSQFFAPILSELVGADTSKDWYWRWFYWWKGGLGSAPIEGFGDSSF